MVDCSHLKQSTYLTLEEGRKIDTLVHTPARQTLDSHGENEATIANRLKPPMSSIPPRSSIRRRTGKNVNAGERILAPICSGLTMDVFRSVLTSIDLDRCEENGENAFYVCDLAYVYRQYLRWQGNLGGRVDAFFAVKCNPDVHVLRMFAKLGIGFDCASHAEIELVLSLGVSPSKIIYANPCKASSFVRHAHSSGVDMMTFDNADELQKVAKYHPTAKMVLRILTDDSGSLCRLGEKFGAPLGSVRGLLERARDLGVDVIGVAFHVGSGCSNPDLYTEAVGRAKWTFELAAEVGYKFNLLDVGGGFGDANFTLLADGLLAGLDRYFPIGCGVRVIAEPGRYFVTKAFELATNIIARRQAIDAKVPLPTDNVQSLHDEEGPVTLYYVNDGVYGAFNCIMFDHQVPQPKVLTLGGVFHGDGYTDLGYPTGPLTPCLSDHGMDSSVESLESFDSLSLSSRRFYSFPNPVPFLDAALQSCKIFGPSCDSIDLVCSSALLPVKHLQVGDWIRWPNMGAYTICAASQFNGFKISEVKYTIGDPAIEVELRRILDGCA